MYLPRPEGFIAYEVNDNYRQLDNCETENISFDNTDLYLLSAVFYSFIFYYPSGRVITDKHLIFPLTFS